jgi:hypothetical protein
LVAVALAAGCTQQRPASTSSVDLADPGDMTLLVNGCPPLTAPVATPGDGGRDGWASYAQGFFASYCTRCHSSTLVGDARNGAPDGYNWDDQASVRAHLDLIRSAVGVANFMPPSDPRPACDERRRIVAWIDAGAAP